MNMLTNRVPFGLLTPEEQELFEQAGIENCEVYVLMDSPDEYRWTDDLKNIKCFEDFKALAFRLKPKEGEYYTSRVHGFDKGTHKIDKAGIENATKLGDSIDLFRLSTQEEIDRVKPKFKYGDIISDSKDDCYICRVENIDEATVNALSRIYDGSKFGFDINAATPVKCMSHATKDQVKQLEIEEMKAGKKWNGDGYDDWLTADGLTWNELIEHDLSEIEYFSLGEYNKTSSGKGDFGLALGIDRISRYRVKPKEPEETYKDVDIMWNAMRAGIKHPNGEIMDLVDVPLNIPIDGYFLYGYYDKKGEPADALPHHQLLSCGLGDEGIFRKATHARFVKMEETP